MKERSNDRTRENDNAKCPFYLNEKHLVIYCEGIMSGTRTGVTFAGTQSKKRHCERYCEAGYKDCMVYRSLLEKYEG